MNEVRILAGLNIFRYILCLKSLFRLSWIRYLKIISSASAITPSIHRAGVRRGDGISRTIKPRLRNI